MATNYALKILDAKTNEWATVAVFSDNLSLDVIIDMGRTLWDDVDEADDVSVVDMGTNNVMWYYSDDVGENEPDNIDDDCGFDPYLRCYTDDC